MFGSLYWILLAALGASAFLWLSCSRLEHASHNLARHWGVPDMVKGSVITAVSSSFPEFVTAVLAIQVHRDFELGLAAIIGSAIYNILVIPAFSVFARGESLQTNRELVFREAQFYLVSITVLLLVICFAVIYNGSPEVAADGTRTLYGNFTRTLALFPLGLYLLYLYIQYEEIRDHRRTTERAPDVNVWKEIAALLVAMGVIVAGVEILIRCALALGDMLNTPTFLWGLTVVAAATSLPDTFISVRASKLGRQFSSVSNVLGSNVFDLLVAVPTGVLLAGAIPVNFTQTVPMMCFLMVATVAMLVFMRHDLKVTITEAVLMTTLYVGFGLWMALEAFGVTTVLGLPS